MTNAFSSSFGRFSAATPSSLQLLAISYYFSMDEVFEDTKARSLMAPYTDDGFSLSFQNVPYLEGLSRFKLTVYCTYLFTLYVILQRMTRKSTNNQLAVTMKYEVYTRIQISPSVTKKPSIDFAVPQRLNIFLCCLSFSFVLQRLK
ncbi:hypothetical protein HHK36_000283 [Tetracentron sinense]|uniref:Uncharacterized protein n=1 Tax=Tetracentron sinense TaxID=13715 RepID=A0A835DTV2_TETSI|nr:hypothetical protein HHK36_000283 [Tetracentron sinense]